MVGVVTECRMGNQLFQFAFIQSIAKRLKTTAFIHDTRERFILPDYFDLAGYHPLLNFLKKVIFKLVNNPFEAGQSTRIDAVDDALIEQPTNNIIYGGYFQSVRYFNNIANDIHQYVRVKKKYRDKFNKKFGDFFAQKKVIAIHVRRGDYLKLNDWWADNFGSHDLTLPRDYYLRSLQKVKDHQNYQIIFISDDVEYIKSTFGDLDNAICVSNEMIIDLQILINADVCIVSNSSFSWWGAFLNNKEHKKIICPQYWLGFKVNQEYPEHIIPDDWLQVNAGLVT